MACYLTSDEVNDGADEHYRVWGTTSRPVGPLVTRGPPVTPKSPETLGTVVDVDSRPIVVFLPCVQHLRIVILSFVPRTPTTFLTHPHYWNLFSGGDFTPEVLPCQNETK